MIRCIVKRDRRRRNLQDVADLLHRLAFGDQLQHLHIAVS